MFTFCFTVAKKITNRSNYVYVKIDKYKNGNWPTRIFMNRISNNPNTCHWLNAQTEPSQRRRKKYINIPKYLFRLVGNILT